MPFLLSSFYFFYFAVVGVYIIFMPKVLSGLGYSAEEIGIIFAAGPLVRFILPMLFSLGLRVSRNIFNFALFVMVSSAISFYFSVNDFYMLLFSNIFLGAGLSLVHPSIEVVSLTEIGKERYGKVRLFGSVGFVLVALVLVEFLSSAQIALNFLLTLTVITAGVAFVIMTKVDKLQEKRAEELPNDIAIFKAWQLWLGLILMQLSFGAFYNFFTIYATDHGIALDVTIYLWSVGVLAEIVMLFYQGKFLKDNLLFLLQLTTLLTAFRWFLLFLFADNLVVLYLSQTIHAFSFALFHSAAIAYLYNFYKNKVLAQQFFSGITYGLGGLVGSLLSGYIYENYPEYLFLSSAFIAFGAFVFISLWKVVRKREVLGANSQKV